MKRFTHLYIALLCCEVACVPLAHAAVKQIKVTPTIQTAAYEAADQVGGIQTLTGAGFEADRFAKLSTLTIIDKDSEGAAMRVLFFSTLPTLTSVDGAALAITDAVMAASFLGSVEIVGNDYVAAAGTKAATLANIQLDLFSTALNTSLQKNGNLYAVVQMVGTPTYTAASDLVFVYSFQD
jgi:hypothetical protein